jgi:YspA, cpYpsA-related SLOG family
MLRVIICGGRAYDLTLGDWDWLDTLGIVHVRHGDALGADAGAQAWAVARGIPSTVYPANWTLGRGAGPLRNSAMLKALLVDRALGHPVAVLAFPGDTGTTDMCKKATAAGVQVVQAHEDVHEDPHPETPMPNAPTRRTFFMYAALAAAAAPLLELPLRHAAALGMEPYAMEEAVEAAAHLLLLTESEVRALPPDTRRALAEALLYALKYDQETSWLAASVLAHDFVRLPELITRLQGLLETRATTLKIL